VGDDIMREVGKEELVLKGKKSDTEFSAELNIEFDYNAKLHPNGKEEISRVKDFYDERL
jgi:hypothetical protein